jgi:hypothetical protein
VLQQIADAISTYLNKNASQVIFYAVDNNGTIHINGSIEDGASNSSAIALAKQLKNFMASHPNFLPFHFSSSTADPYYDDDPILEPAPNNNDNNNGWSVYHIVGVTVGIGLFLLCLVCLIPCIVMLCRRKKKKEESEESESSRNKKYHEQEYQSANGNDFSEPGMLKSHGRDF